MDNERRPEAWDALEAMNAVVNTPPVRRKKNFFEKNIIPLKGDSKQVKTRKGIFDSCLIVIFVCALILVWVVVIDPLRAKILQEKLKEIYEATEVVATEPPVPATEPPEGQTAPPTTTKVVYSTRQATGAELLTRNGDYIGWLKAPGAEISLPVVQTADNLYYLKRDFDRKPSKYGNPFVDFRVNFNPMSTNMIIYGHHMNNGTIFTYLTRYKNVNTVKNNPLITMEMADGTKYQYKIVSVLAVNGRAQDDNGYVFAVNTPDFPSQESFEGYKRQIESRSYVDTGVDIVYGDKLISLQTCVYTYDYEFLYVIARMVRPGESTAVTGVKANPSPRMPQAWYDKMKQENPYRNAEIWLAP